MVSEPGNEANQGHVEARAIPALVFVSCKVESVKVYFVYGESVM